MIFALILLVLLGISVLYNIGNFASLLFHGRSYRYAGSHTVGPRLEEATLEDHDASAKIAVIKVDGIITGQIIDQGGFSMVDLIKAQLKRAEDDNNVKAVILKVDSPGGEVLAADEIYRAISEFQRHSPSKPVVASMGSLAASGGYYVSAPCRWIVANEMTITGSIGVILSSWNYRGLMDKVGVLPQTFKSGKYKDMLSGSREPDTITPEEKQMVQNLIDQTFKRFKTVVKEGRDQAYAKSKEKEGRPLNGNWQDYADGRVLSGGEAYDLGFVDQLGTFDNAVKKTEELAGIGEANLIEYQQHFDLSDLFRLFGKSDAKSVKLELGVDLPKLQAGRLYFLAPTFLR